ncbi:MAG: ECF transporter S component [Lachnospirales bacterium]
MNTKTKKLTLMSLMASIIILMTFVPYTGYISYGFISITTIHIPVIIGSMILGKKEGLILGLVWGISNLIKAYTSMTPEALIFLDPRISVLPRALVGFLAGLSGDLFIDKIYKNPKITSVFAVCLTIIHTALVITAIALWGQDNMFNFGENILSIFKIVISVNGIVEIALAAIITPVIITALAKSGALRKAR